MTLEQLYYSPSVSFGVIEKQERQYGRGQLLDIGVFDENHSKSYGREILKSGVLKAVTEEVNTVINKLKGNHQAKFDLIPSLKNLSQDKLMKLRAIADTKYERAISNGEKELDDLKIDLTREELVVHVGSIAVEELESTFGQKYDEILIRRCQAHGKFINFHTDFSLRTMQVALNSDCEYSGGNLVYAIDGNLVAPKRPAGTVSIHQNDIVHGVSLLNSGVRYGLFFL